LNLRYLTPQISKLKKDFDFEVMDIYEFCIEFGYSVMYDRLSDTRNDVLMQESRWLEIASKMADDYSRKSVSAYLDALRYKNSKFMIPYMQPNDMEAFNRSSNHFSFVPSDEEVFVDIGAYNGDTVLKFINSTPSGKYKIIHAFEPNPSLFPRLKEKKEWIPNLEVYQVALSDQEATLSFVKQEMGSRIATEGVDYDVEVVEVAAKPLDSCISYATLIKIDVEGFEAEVVKGASNLISKCKPSMVIDTYHHSNDALKIYEEVMRIHEYKYVSWRMSGLNLHSLYFSDEHRLS
jgi:FkbM family methyltransferase